MSARTLANRSRTAGHCFVVGSDGQLGLLDEGGWSGAPRGRRFSCRATARDSVSASWARSSSAMISRAARRACAFSSRTSARRTRASALRRRFRSFPGLVLPDSGRTGSSVLMSTACQIKCSRTPRRSPPCHPGRSECLMVDRRCAIGHRTRTVTSDRYRAVTAQRSGDLDRALGARPFASRRDRWHAALRRTCVAAEARTYGTRPTANSAS